MNAIEIRYSAVAITSSGEFIPFGPGFPTEDDAWRWLHYDATLFPEHKSIDVFPIA